MVTFSSSHLQVVLDEYFSIRFFKDIKACSMDSLAANRDELAVPYPKAELVAAVVVSAGAFLFILEVWGGEPW